MTSIIAGGAFTFETGLVDEHPTIVKLRALSDRVASSEATVLITGESGTGKEVVAKAIHAMSSRRDHQFVPLQIPPLRERRSDIPILIVYFLERVRWRNPKRQLSVTRDAMVHLWSYDWPGNVRELENMVERPAILADGNEITTSILPQMLLDTTRPQTPMIPAALGEGGVDLNKLVRELEGRFINEALKQTGGNKQAAARLLGLKRTTFAAKLRRCGVVTPLSSDESEED